MGDNNVSKVNTVNLVDVEIKSESSKFLATGVDANDILFLYKVN